MKSIGKALGKEIARIVVILVVIAAVVFYLKDNNWFKKIFDGDTEAKYEYVVKRFSKRNELLVADAEVDKTAMQTFNPNATKDWPDWTKAIANVIVSRKLEMKIPVKTEFKLELADISKNDIDIKNNVLTFKNPLTVKVDSQKEGDLEILSSSSGIVDKAVDVVTSNKKAMEFLDKKSQTAIYKTSNDVMKQEKYQKKVAKYISQDLEQLLNLKSNDKISVKVNVSDLKFENIDPKE
ncbi:hypothetical protein SAMN05216400_1070 [Streptococcus equinus]|uniref:DUF4230 domain-containing protein n=2 Tax=Streptococcus equinus TaxID=1335 RepID=A0A1G9L2X8_STREI|nr:hypothetical protein SAMN05216400_1070 [Streptococcus equinus]